MKPIATSPIIAIFITCCMLVPVSDAQERFGDLPQVRRNDNTNSGLGLTARGIILIDPDDYANCTGFLLNRMFLVSGNFYLDLRGYLSLSNDQVEELMEIRLDFIRENAELESELSIALIELEDLLERNDITANTIALKIDDVYDLEAEYQTERIEALIEARKVLTDPQQILVDALRQRNSNVPREYYQMNEDMQPDRR